MLIQIADAGGPALAGEGWERRFTADPARVREAVELYTKLGYEVRIESVRAAEFKDECGGCHAVPVAYKTIYTRKRSS